MSPDLLPCPFCGGSPRIVNKDVEPQNDPWFSPKHETFVLCDCGACLFDETFHEGFGEYVRLPSGEYAKGTVEESATTAWNRRAGSQP